MTFRSRFAQAAALLTATLGLMVAMFAASPSHDQEQEENAVVTRRIGPGPARGDAVAMPRGLIGLAITLGLGATEPAAWDGEVTVSEGRLVDLEIVRSGAVAEVDGGKFRVQAKNQAANKKQTNKKKQAAAKKKAANAAANPALLHASLEAPETATVTVRTEAGTFSFRPADLKRGERTPFLGGQTAVERQDAAVRLTGRRTEDDFPATARAADGTVWLAYVEYTPEVPHLARAVPKAEFDSLVPTKHGDRVRLRSFDGATWAPGLDVTESGLDVWRPTVAVDGRGKVWVAWAQQVDGDWEIFGRSYTPPVPGAAAGAWTEPARLTNTRGTDFHVVAATDSRGTVWLAWQAFRGDNYDILAMPLGESPAAPHPEPVTVSASPADDWSPAIAADARGGVFVAWDTYDRGNFDVMVRDVGRRGSPIAVAASPRFEARASLAVDQGNRLWVAFEEGDEQWGKDFAHAGSVANVGLEKNAGFALYIQRTVQLRCLDDGRMMVPAAGSEPNFGAFANRNKSVPRLGIGGDGTLWMFVRHYNPAGGQGEVWYGSALAFDGEHWQPPRSLASSANLIDNRPALAAVGSGLLAVYSTDHRQSAATRVEDDLYAAWFGSATTPTTTPKLVEAPPAPAATLAAVHPAEADDIARVRAHRVELGGKTLRPVRGEFHRHTEVSSHGDGDGLLEDTWRYALDAANHDWMGNGDHDNGAGFEYIWWIIQKSADIHHNPTRFVAAQTYERSVVYPNGHRNVMMPRRGIRPLPRGELPGTAEAGTPDTKLLYEYLKHFGGICASHTSATDMGTDWRDNDPTVEPVVEIYQGHRHSYETSGPPRSPTEATQIGGYQPKGFVWNALEKGYRLGFESSSDHISTHLSYAILYVEEATRPALIDAFKKKHCYAATDNILLEVRSGEHFMGDAFATREKPNLQVIVKGTAPVARLHVVRDNKYVLSTEPNSRDVTFRYADDEARPGESHYYYVRVEQADGNLAWASPMWVTYEK